MCLNFITVCSELVDVVFPSRDINICGWYYTNVILVHDAYMFITFLLQFLATIEWVQYSLIESLSYLNNVLLRPK